MGRVERQTTGCVRLTALGAVSAVVVTAVVGAVLAANPVVVHLGPGDVVYGAQFLDCAREIVYGPFVVVPEVLEIRFDLLYKLIVSLNSTVGVDLLECLHDGRLAGEFGLTVNRPAWAWLSGGGSRATTTGGHGALHRGGGGSFGCPARAGGTV